MCCPELFAWALKKLYLKKSISSLCSRNVGALVNNCVTTLAGSTTPSAKADMRIHIGTEVRLINGTRVCSRGGRAFSASAKAYFGLITLLGLQRGKTRKTKEEEWRLQQRSLRR